jgi:hypothetical protein
MNHEHLKVLTNEPSSVLTPEFLPASEFDKYFV